MRFQVDEQREKLKEKIDEIALKMIDQTTKYEQLYLETIKESFSSFEETQSLEMNLIEIEETFREPNVLIESIKEMRQKRRIS